MNPGLTPASVATAAGRTGLAGVVALALPALLAACAGSSDPAGASALAKLPAAPAVSGPSARLLLRGAVPAEDRFAAVQLADALECKNPRLLTAGTPQKMPEPALLAVGGLTTLDFLVLRGGKSGCAVRLSFTPGAGKTYLLQGMVVGAGCSARLFDASVADRPVPVADAVQRNSGSQACLPLAQALANSAGAASAIQGGGQHLGEAVLNPAASAKDLEGLIKP
jgi:hypothetical protein